MKSIALITSLLTLTAMTAQAESIFDIKLKDIDGKETTLGAYQGKAVLIVNVASKCGFTKQYETLEKTYRKYAGEGLVVLGFPCNQFGGQEPGTNEEIKEFCTSTYDVTFPLFDKIEVNGKDRHSLYSKLTGANSPFPGKIQWNFTKFLVGRDGSIVGRFGSKVNPDSPELIEAIEAALSTERNPPSP